MFLLALFSFVLITVNTKSISTNSKRSSFYVIPLGVTGGLYENSLSCYLLTTVNNNIPDSTYIALDSGTIRYGLEKAINKNSLPSNTNIQTFMQEQIKAYIISHGHLDHISGLIINSLDDKPGKSIIGLNETIHMIQNSYFNNQAWIDAGPNGTKTYNYQILNPLSRVSVPIANTSFNVRIFRLCHPCPYLSSAFLISRRDQSSASVLYLGDTGPDDLENIIQADNTTYFPKYLNQLWKEITPLIAAHQLKAIFIETSYANGRPDNELFGHLTPDWLLNELDVLSTYHSIKTVPIIITHIKPATGAREAIIDQLTSGGNSNYNFIFPVPGEPIWL